MADERDPDISARYRELGAEEPPRALDDAILAAARRGASARPASLDRAQRQRWYAPLATAAVLVLAVAVTLHLQQEKPDIAAPVSSDAPQPSAAPEGEAKLRMEQNLKTAREAAAQEAAAQEQRRKLAEAKPADRAFTPDPSPAAGAPKPAKPAVGALAPRAELPPSPALRSDDSRAAGSLARQEDRTARDAAAAARAPAYGAVESQVQKQAAEAPAAPAAAPVPAPPPPARAAPAPPTVLRGPSLLAKEREAAPEKRARPAAAGVSNYGTAADMVSGAPVTVTASGLELERIAELRAEGKHDEADKALAEFRKRFPDYKIPEETLRRVERR